VGSGGAKYDLKKLAAVQGEHIRLLSGQRIAELALPFLLVRPGLEGVKADDPRLVPAFESVRVRASTLADAAERVDFYFREPVFDDATRKKFLTPAVAPHLAGFAEVLASTENFSAAELEQRTEAWLAAQGLAMKDVAQAARVALTGRSAAPGLFEIMLVLGRDESVRRVRHGQALAEGG
jgi:glutamyl-tRNA synthetase